MFMMVGRVEGIQQKITYEYQDGKGSFYGDKAITFLLKWELDSKSVVGPVGQYMEADINNPLSVVFALRQCFDSIEQIEGELPEAEEIPEGSIC